MPKDEHISTESIFRSKKWPVSSSYRDDEHGRIVSTGTSRHIDLSNEFLHIEMMRAWLSIETEADVNQWLESFGFPYEVGLDGPPSDPKVARSMEAIHLNRTDLLQHATNLSRRWKLYLMAHNRTPGWDDSVRVELVAPPPGSEWFEEDIDEFGIILSYRNDPDTQKRLGRENYAELKRGRNPFPAQYKKIQKEFDAACKKFPNTNREWSGEVVHLIDPSACSFSLAVPGFEDLIEGSYVESVVDALYDAPSVVSKLMKLPLVWTVNRALKELSPSVKVIIDSQGARCVSDWVIEYPIQAVYLALYKEVTGETLWDTCPHPDCKKLFEKKPANKVSCGSARCQSFVTRKRKRQQEN
jgi:hypothetical protein